ncbi:hypothetical protein DSO57_1012161 [Entomophthora muscae]|uniref:Uncharacterized protein n=1 Tax=Entomophthora muscae TaxID=34485 RepID=A0ACC2SUU2_9FUNG|nr:hypothetical protein DSO57_1012161 [Entomophthora muscae]
MIEAWKIFYSPEEHNNPKKIPEHFIVSFQLWMNSWSLLITLIGKWHEQSQGFNNKSPISSQEKPKEAFKTPNSGFSNMDIEVIEDKIYAMDRSIESIWGCLSQFYHPEPHTIPSDLVLGTMLIAVKQEKFQTCGEIFHCLAEVYS